MTISDTAGIRNSKDEIEKKGIKLSLDRAENADLKLVVVDAKSIDLKGFLNDLLKDCLLYTSPSPRDISGSRMPSSA